MKKIKTLYVSNRKDWRAWREKNFDQEKEIWLVNPKKSSGKPRLAYKRIRIAYIDSARKRPEEFRKRLANFIKKTKENKQIGFGGIEKYY